MQIERINIMKNTGKTLYIVSGVAILIMLFGCVSAPGTYPTVEGSDDELLTPETKNAVQQQQNEQKFKIAVLPERAKYTNSYVEKYEINKVVGDQVEALCSGLSMFEIVARQELDIVSAENALKNLTSPNAAITLPKPVDGLLIYSITVCNIETREFTEYQYEGRRRVQKRVPKSRGQVTLKITLVSTKNQTKLFTKTFSGKTDWSANGEYSQMLFNSITHALADFTKQFAYDFSPVGHVIQTTGNGRWAKISLGTGAGLRFHTKVEFVIKDANGLWRPFAYGEVREPNYDYAWVLVKDFENAKVRNNARVKVAADQSRSIGEALSEAFIYGKKE